MDVEIALCEFFFFAAPTVAQLALLIEQRQTTTVDFKEGAL